MNRVAVTSIATVSATAVITSIAAETKNRGTDVNSSANSSNNKN